MAKQYQPRVIRKVNLGGTWVFAAVPQRNGRYDPKHVVYKGATLPVDGGTWHLDFREASGARRRPAIAGGLEGVTLALRAQQNVLELRAMGVAAPDALQIQAAAPAEGKSLRTITDEFKASPPAKLRPRTVAGYVRALESFTLWANGIGITHASQVDKALIERWVKVLAVGKAPRTIRWQVANLVRMLKRAEFHVDVRGKDLPKALKSKKDVYQLAVLEELFAACRPTERLIYEFFLLTGFREGEVAHFLIEGMHVEECTVEVLAVPEFGFIPKDYEERTVRIPRWLMDKLVGHVAGLRKGARLVFETKPRRGGYHVDDGRPDKNLLEKLKAIAFRAGKNCGRCQATYKKQPVTCATHPVCGKFGLHKFRHTFATNFLRDKGDIRTLQKLMGHSDLESTMVYLHALDAEDTGEFIEESTLAKVGR